MPGELATSSSSTGMSKPRLVGSQYFRKALSDPSGLVRAARVKLKNKRFDVIACTGMSGLSFGPVLAYSMRKRLLLVRKSIKGNHATDIVEGYLRKGDRVLLVDDFTSSGATRDRMCEKIAEVSLSLKVIGIYYYKYDEFEVIK